MTSVVKTRRIHHGALHPQYCKLVLVLPSVQVPICPVQIISLAETYSVFVPNVKLVGAHQASSFHKIISP